MTALDDALNSSSIVWGTHALYAYWREIDNGDIATNIDSPSNLTEQLTGVATIDHSLDDGLPDSVTMTSGNDASGSLSAGLNGRPGLTYFNSGYRATVAGNTATGFYSAGTTLTGPIPSNVQRGDYLVTALLTDNVTAIPIQSGDVDPKDAWAYLGNVISSGNILQLYGARYYPGRAALKIQGANSFNYNIGTMAFWGTNVNGIPLAYRIGKVATFSETTSQTAHSVASTIDDGRSYQLSAWGCGSSVGTWTAGATAGTKFVEQTGNGLDLMFAVSPLRDTGVTTLTSSTASATSSAVAIAVVLHPFPRPMMDAREYFSPFNKTSPVYGFDRDTASVLYTFNTLTASGVVGTGIFNGIMSDIPISGRQAEIDAVSNTRIALNTSITLPVVFSYREGCTVDWLVGWLLSRGGRYVGPAPTVYTRAWVPFYGSTHSYIESPYYYNFAREYNTTSGTWLGWKKPTAIKGPWYGGMYAEQTATRCREVYANFIRPDLYNPNDIGSFQADTIFGKTTPQTLDVMSQTNSSGRITFWLRGDAAQAAPTYMPGSEDFLFLFYNNMYDTAGNTIGSIRICVGSTDRKIQVQMGSTAAGFSNYIFSGPGALGTTGAWEFYGIWYNFATGECRMTHTGGTENYSNAWATDGRNVITNLPVTDLQGRTLGYGQSVYARSHVPIADFMWDVIPPGSYSSATWANWTTPVTPGATVITRPTLQWIQAVANPNPVTAWDTIADLAQAVFAMYRANEDDKFEFLPPSYFGETSQLTASSVADVSLNAQDLGVTLDPSKSRNLVTIQFAETAVTTNVTAILTVSQSTPIPPGLTLMTFTLDQLAAEIHGQSNPFGSSSLWNIYNLYADQITNAQMPTGIYHYMSVNTAADGTGTVLPATKVSGTIITGDAATITIQFNNRTGATTYLANNGTEIPFMCLLGYAVTTNDGYVTARDGGSIGVRQDRGLSTDIEWIQDRATATDATMLLVTMLARPRAEVTVRVVGDPRRRPGQLVTIKDSAGTRAAGTWRILSVTHNISGAQYVQDLSLVFVGPILNWDDTTTTWDNSIWGP